MNKVVTFFVLIIFMFSCEIDNTNRELIVLDNSISDEITFILELNTKDNSRGSVEEFTQYLSDFIV